MRKNLFMKSMYRKPLLTLLMILLIALGSFMFVLRTVEFITVRSEINQLNSMFRSIGMIRSHNYFDDVSDAVKIISNSPYVRFTDNRVGIEGILLDMYTPNMGGMVHGLPRDQQGTVSEAIFTARISGIRMLSNVWEHGFQSLQYELDLIVDTVFAGASTLVVPRQRLTLTVDLPSSVFNELGWFRGGETYLFRAGRYIETTLGAVVIAREGANNPMHLLPLSETIMFLPRTHWPLNRDFTSVVGLEYLMTDINFLNHHQHAIYLQPTRDMSTLPIMQRSAAQVMSWPSIDRDNPFLINIIEGRMLTYEDYINHHHVAVISLGFASSRAMHGDGRLHVGDTIRVNIPITQQVAGLAPLQRDIIVRSDPQSATSDILELEIVGIFHDNVRNNPAWGLFHNTFVYIPESLIPDNLQLFPPPENVISGWTSQEYIPSIWFNFELYDARYEQHFMNVYGPKLNDMGFHLMLFEGRSQVFWAAVAPMILVVTFNAVLFWSVMLLVLMLVILIFLYQRFKDIAILRALGFSKMKLSVQLLLATFLYFFPAIIIGGLFGWIISMRVVDQTLTPLADIVIGFEPAVVLSWQWFFGIIVIIVLILLMLLLISFIMILKLPVLALLQGKKSKKDKNILIYSDISTENTMAMGSFTKTNNFTTQLNITLKNKVINLLRFTNKQLIRSKLKTIIVTSFIFTFIVMLGWLGESIIRTYYTIDAIYDATLIEGSIVKQDSDEHVPGRMFGDAIRRRTVDDILNSGFIKSYYLESVHARSFIIPDAENGIFPNNWYEMIDFDFGVSIDLNYNNFDFLFAVSDLPYFLNEHLFNRPGGFNIDFIDGFDINYDFTKSESTPDQIPIIISDWTAYRRGLSLGDAVFMAYTERNHISMNYFQGRIVGVHDGNLAITNLQDAAIIPMNVFNRLQIMQIYFTFNFIVDPIYNREIETVWGFINNAVGRNIAGLVPLRFIFNDQQLFTLTGIARQTFLFLQLIYPIALIVSIVLMLGLNLLLVLQNAKKAAILRVFGTKKYKTMNILLLEQCTMIIIGMVPSFVLLFILRMTFTTQFFFAVGMSFIAIFMGSCIGVFLVLNKTPLEMLQVKE